MHRPPLGQRKAKRRPWSGVRRGPDAATMRFHNRTSDRKSQPGSVRLGGKERVKDLVSLFGGQSNAGIGDGN